MPLLITPGNPTETRSNAGRAFRNSTSPFRTALGVGTVGVTTRWRSLTGCPLASISIALSPEPPISMHMVMGLEVLDEAVCAAIEDLEGLAVISRNCTERQGEGNRESGSGSKRLS